MTIYQTKAAEGVIETFSIPLELKFGSSGQTGEFEGYGAVFGNVDSHGDVIVPGAFSHSLAERKAQGRTIPMHLNHGLPEIGGQRGVGVWTDVSEDQTGLKVRGKISGLNTDAGRLLFERVKDGAFPGLSVGYTVRPNGATYGNKAGQPRRTLKGLNLQEISLVNDPSNPRAVVTGVKFSDLPDFERFLREAGVSRSAARKLAAGGYPALDPSHGDADPAIGGLVTRILAATGELKHLKGS